MKQRIVRRHQPCGSVALRAFEFAIEDFELVGSAEPSHQTQRRRQRQRQRQFAPKGECSHFLHESLPELVSEKDKRIKTSVEFNETVRFGK